MGLTDAQLGRIAATQPGAKDARSAGAARGSQPPGTLPHSHKRSGAHTHSLVSSQTAVLMLSAAPARNNEFIAFIAKLRTALGGGDLDTMLEAATRSDGMAAARSTAGLGFGETVNKAIIYQMRPTSRVEGDRAGSRGASSFGPRVDTGLGAPAVDIACRYFLNQHFVSSQQVVRVLQLMDEMSDGIGDRGTVKRSDRVNNTSQRFHWWTVAERKVDPHKVNFTVASYGKVCDRRSMSTVFRALSPAEYVAAATRLGWMNVLNMVDPGGLHYVLHMSNPEEKEVLRCLCRLAMKCTAEREHRQVAANKANTNTKGTGGRITDERVLDSWRNVRLDGKLISIKQDDKMWAVLSTGRQGELTFDMVCPQSVRQAVASRVIGRSWVAFTAARRKSISADLGLAEPKEITV